MEEDIGPEIPETRLYDFTHTVVRDGEVIFRLSASYAERYAADHRTILEDVVFQEYGEDGEILTEGTAEEAVFFEDTENADLEGGIRVYSLREETTVEAESLFWDSEKRLLTAEEDHQVSIEKDDGDQVSGTGFEADLREKSILFTGSSRGKLVVPEEEDEGAGE